MEKTKPLHWPLEFWYAFFDENGDQLNEEERGFDIVVGNPPYISKQFLSKGHPDVENFLDHAEYKSRYKNYDLAVVNDKHKISNLQAFNSKISINVF